MEVTTVTVITTETSHPLPHCAHTHCLVSIDVQQLLMNVTGCHYFHVEEFNPRPLLHAYFHIRHHSVRLPLCCYLSHSNNTLQNISRKVQSLLLSHQHPYLTWWANIIKEEALLSEHPCCDLAWSSTVVSKIYPTYIYKH